MTFSNKMNVNFSGGEVIPEMNARTDLPLFNKVLSRMQNFIAEPQGPARYRSGTRYVHHTRGNNRAVFIEFQFSDIQAYVIEATEGYFRFYKDEGIIFQTSAELVITGVSNANPGVISYTGPDPIEGQEVYLTELGGITQLNGSFFLVGPVNAGANTFQIKTIFGDNVDTTAYGVYTSGGKGQIVYEIQTPYLDEHLDAIRYAQNADTMYLVNIDYEPRKLTRSAHDNWSLARYSRTNDQFSAENETFGTITGVNTATDTISDPGHTFVAGDHVFISGVVGTTELNYKHATVFNPGVGNYQLKDYRTGVLLNLVNAWSSGGIVEKIGALKYPAAVGFTDDARLAMAGSKGSPETQWYSRSPASSGAVRFDDYTTGTDATHALFFTLAPLQGKVDSIRWITNTDKYIALGTFGSVRRVFGATETASITPDEVTAKGANSDGVYSARPVVDGSVLFYISRSGLSLETIEYDYQVDGYSPDDKNLVAYHLSTGGMRQIARQVGRPTIIWALRNDGVLMGLTFKAKENIAGWHRHIIGGDGIVENIAVMPRENQQDQLWLSVKRVINGHTVRYVEFITDPPIYPDPVDFYTGQNNKNADALRFVFAQSEKAKQAIHLDCSLSYDGSVYGTNAEASITLGTGADVSGTEGVSVTASASVFTASMVGRQIWGAYDTDGVGGGRLEITAFVSGTEVEGTILDEFDDTDTFAAGSWYLTATSISGLDHLEGETVRLITDGAVPDSEVVSGGAVSFAQPASVVHVGYPYRGVLRTLPLDQGGVSGPAQSKLKIVAKVAIRFINSAGCSFGANLYNLTDIAFRKGNDLTDMAVPLFTGVDESFYEDSYEGDKILTVLQENPLPCTIAAFDIYMDTVDE